MIDNVLDFIFGLYLLMMAFLLSVLLIEVKTIGVDEKTPFILKLSAYGFIILAAFFNLAVYIFSIILMTRSV